MAVDQQAVQRQAEAEARAVVQNILVELGCARPDRAAARIHEVYRGRFAMRALRRGPEYCPTEGHEYTRMPCGLCTPLDDRQEDDGV